MPSATSLSIDGFKWVCHCDIGGWGPSRMYARKAHLIWSAFPELETLCLTGSRILLDRIVAPKLRRFEINAGYLGIEHAQAPETRERLRTLCADVRLFESWDDPYPF
jgi:hypothetical protein